MPDEGVTHVATKLPGSRAAGALETPAWESQIHLSTRSKRFQLAIKRVLDVAGAGLALILLCPVLAILALLVRLGSPGPMLFRQRRLGRRGRLFTIHKLRTMVDGAPMVLNHDGSTCVVDGDPRVTRLGAVLRRRGLDELPQLVNVLKGDMSFIGPRPDLEHQILAYSGRDFRRLALRPGITSLAQVSGRNTLPWRERMALEVEYVERFSLWLDLQIAWRTLGVVLRGRGVNNPAPPARIDPGSSSPPQDFIKRAQR